MAACAWAYCEGSGGVADEDEFWRKKGGSSTRVGGLGIARQRGGWFKTHCRQTTTCHGWPCCWSSQTTGRRRCSRRNWSCWRAAVAKRSMADWPCRSRGSASSVLWSRLWLSASTRPAGCGGERRTGGLVGGVDGIAQRQEWFLDARSSWLRCKGWRAIRGGCSPCALDGECECCSSAGRGRRIAKLAGVTGVNCRLARSRPEWAYILMWTPVSMLSISTMPRNSMGIECTWERGSMWRAPGARSKRLPPAQSPMHLLS